MPTPDNLTRFGQYQGSFGSPFREHLGFGKLTWLPDARPDGGSQRQPAPRDRHPQLRRPDELRERRERPRQRAHRGSCATSGAPRAGWSTRPTAQFLQSQFNPGAENPDLVGQEYVGVVKIGGRDTDQDIVQRTITLRDDVTFPSVRRRAAITASRSAPSSRSSTTRSSARCSAIRLFQFRDDPGNNLDFDAPFEAQFGVGDPRVTASNTQIGLYAQDDWQLDPRLDAEPRDPVGHRDQPAQQRLRRRRPTCAPRSPSSRPRSPRSTARTSSAPTTT